MGTPPMTASRDALIRELERHIGAHASIVANDLLASGVVRAVDEVRAEALTEAANEWTQGAWADTPRRADRVADRMAAAQYAGDWLRARAAALATPADPSEA